MNNTIQSLILDIDGVIWRNKEPIGNLEALFGKIVRMGLSYAFATNNSTKSVDTYVELLSGFNIPVTRDHINTSATVTARYLQKKLPEGSELYVIGMDGLKTTA